MSIGKAMLIALFSTALLAAPLTPVAAEEISPSQLQAAQAVAKSAPALGDFDLILPQIAARTKDQLISQRPDLYQDIGKVVDAAALKLASRRAELDNDIARVWAKNFTENELQAINAFFSSDVGKKYKEVAAATVGPDILKAVKNWSNRVGSELLDSSKQDLKKMGYDF